MLLLSLSCSLLFAFLQATTPAQPPANAPTTVQALADSPTPTDPKELLDLGRKVNGLTGPDIQPWHLKATFEIFDDDGKSNDKGTLEEWWISDKQYKVTYSSAQSSQTDFGTDNGVFRTGNPYWPIGPLAQVHLRLVHPLPSEEHIANFSPEIAEREFGSVKLRCVLPKSKLPQKGDPPIPATYCFSIEKPFLRYSSTINGFEAITFSRILLFRGRYVGGDIIARHLSKPYVNIHVDSLDPIEQVDMSEFQPTPDAKPAPLREGTEVVAGKLIKKGSPNYPLAAKELGVQGVVVIQAVIGKDGHILDNLRVVSGPPELRNSALDAARQWVFTPYLLNGQPVEIETVLKVAFFLPTH
jgi:TonB family protein